MYLELVPYFLPYFCTTFSFCGPNNGYVIKTLKYDIGLSNVITTLLLPSAFIPNLSADILPSLIAWAFFTS